MNQIPQSLTPDQRRAVEDDAMRTLLVAPAGSGKTEVLIRRLLRILTTTPGETFRVLSLTYTVKASQQFRDRAAAAVSDEVWRLDADTLHGFALDWIRRHGQAIGVDPYVVVYADNADRMQLVADFVRSLGLDGELGDDVGATVKPVLRALDDHRTRHVDGSFQCCAQTRFFGQDLETIHDAYVDAMVARSAIDFPGMLCSFRELLRIDPWVTKNFRATFKHVLVDEGQDLTPIQAALLAELVGDEVALFVVADDRQSINRFAGGGFENAQRLVGDEAASSPLVLKHNFRCASSVLIAAEKLAEHMVGPPREVAAAPGAPPGQVRVEQYPNSSAQSVGVVSWVQEQLRGLDPAILADGEDRNVAYEDILIVARAAWMLQPVVDRLQSAEIPLNVQTDSGTLLPDSESRIFVDALAFAEKSNDRPARRRVDDELRALGIVDTETLSVDDALRKAGLDSLRRIADLVMEATNGGDLGKVIENLAEESSELGCARGGEILAAAWSAYSGRVRVSDRNVSGFLQHLVRVQQTRPSDPGVRLHTVHKAKGLEYRAVALIDAREGAFPDYRSLETPDLVDDERRSFYVAMTRASRSLLVTWPGTTVDRWDRVHVQLPSRFISEAGLI